MRHADNGCDIIMPRPPQTPQLVLRAFTYIESERRSSSPCLFEERPGVWPPEIANVLAWTRGLIARESDFVERMGSFVQLSKVLLWWRLIRGVPTCEYRNRQME